MKDTFREEVEDMEVFINDRLNSRFVSSENRTCRKPHGY